MTVEVFLNPDQIPDLQNFHHVHVSLIITEFTQIKTCFRFGWNISWMTTYISQQPITWDRITITIVIVFWSPSVKYLLLEPEFVWFAAVFVASTIWGSTDKWCWVLTKVCGCVPVEKGSMQQTKRCWLMRWVIICLVFCRDFLSTDMNLDNIEEYLKSSNFPRLYLVLLQNFKPFRHNLCSKI